MGYVNVPKARPYNSGNFATSTDIPKGATPNSPVYKRRENDTASPGELVLPGDDLFYVVEFVERRHGGEVVDVGVKDFVTDLGQHRVVKLEK